MTTGHAHYVTKSEVHATERIGHAYVPWTYGGVIDEELNKGPSLLLRGLMVCLFIITAAIVVGPFVQPFRDQLGLYLYVHVALIIGGLFWLFRNLLPPPFEATERMRREFMRKLQDKTLQRLGLDPSGILNTALGEDGDTLEIIVAADWLQHPYTKRLQDTQVWWRLWADVYSPYHGWDRALIRLRDAEGFEAGGSKLQAGSLIYVREGHRP